MSLTGVDPNDPTPAVRREFIFGAGPPSAVAGSRPVVLMGNKTSAGSETVSTLGDPIADDADAKARFGARSELYAMYRKLTAIPQTATIYGIACPESAGSAAAKVWTVGDGNSDAVTTYKIEIGGEVDYYTTSVGEEEQSVGEGIAAKITRMAEGKLLCTVGTAEAGGGTDWEITVTAAHKGPRLDNYIDNIRITALKANNTQTVTAGSLTAGATEDDWTNPIAALADSDLPYYVVAAKTAVSAVSATDNGLGELMTSITAQGQPVNGKDMRLVAACIGTNANAVAVATSSSLNTPMAVLVWIEDHDWSTGEIAAHFAGVLRSEEIRHPSANINGWTNDGATGKVWLLPPPNDKNDAATPTEIVTALNNGVTPIGVRGGRTYIVRHITTRSLNANSVNDYTAREGHIPSANHFAWDVARQFYERMRQPFADYDPVGTQPPPARTQTPAMLKSMLNQITDDLSSDAPQSGTYQGPIFAPSASQTDKANTRVTYDGKGGFPTYWPTTPVQHTIKWETQIADQSRAY